MGCRLPSLALTSLKHGAQGTPAGNFRNGIGQVPHDRTPGYLEG